MKIKIDDFGHWGVKIDQIPQPQRKSKIDLFSAFFAKNYYHSRNGHEISFKMSYSNLNKMVYLKSY